jgi:hypothetical protein
MPFGCGPAHFAPVVFSQFKSHPTSGSTDCGPSSVLEGLHLASCGMFDIGVKDSMGNENDKALRIDRIEKTRSYGGMPTTGATSLAQNRKAFNTWTEKQFPKINKTIQKMTTYLGQSFDNGFVPWLSGGANRHAQVFVRYTAIDNYNNHAVSGNWYYTGIHAILITNYHLTGGVAYVTMVDPLTDGRFSGACSCNVANGPQTIPLSILKSAAGGYAGSGLISYNGFTTAQTIPTNYIPTVTLDQFMARIAVIESDNRNYLIHPDTGAFGKYQIMPTNWREWSVLAMPNDKRPRVAHKTIPHTEWIPETTPENQYIIAAYEFSRLFSAQADWRRVAVSWRSGNSIGRRQPWEQRADGTYYWTSGSLKYCNSATNVLGFPYTTRETTLPPLGGGVLPGDPEPPPPPPPPDPIVYYGGFNINAVVRVPPAEGQPELPPPPPLESPEPVDPCLGDIREH